MELENRKKVKSTLKNWFRDLFLNDVANLFQGAFAKIIIIIILTILIVVIRLLNLLNLSVLGIPKFGYFLIGLFCLIGATVWMLSKIPVWRRQVQWTGYREVNDFLWEFNYGELVQGPFCKYCKKLVQSDVYDIDDYLEGFLQLNDTALITHECNHDIPRVVDIKNLRADVAMYAMTCVEKGERKANQIFYNTFGS